MPEPLLAILKICALALLYLFFFRVIRAVWAEVAPARVAPSTPPAAPRAKQPRRRARDGESLVVVEPKEHRGQRYPLGEELTVGRAAGCTVTLDDTYASQLHARLFRRDGQLHVEDLGSTNGTYVNSQKVSGARPLRRGDRVKIGATVFEVET